MRVRDRGLTHAEVRQLRRAELTYAEVGGTRGESLPEGYGHLRRSRQVGVGVDRFREAARVVLGWDMHRRAGLRVRASDDPVVAGAVGVVTAGAGVLSVAAPVRVVYVVDEPRCQGFAYGTLPGHPVTGEESFVVELCDDGAVTLTVTAFSRPATVLARLGGPLGRATQSWAVNRYLQAV